MTLQQEVLALLSTRVYRLVSTCELLGGFIYCYEDIQDSTGVILHVIRDCIYAEHKRSPDVLLALGPQSLDVDPLIYSMGLSISHPMELIQSLFNHSSNSMAIAPPNYLKLFNI